MISLITEEKCPFDERPFGNDIMPSFKLIIATADSSNDIPSSPGMIPLYCMAVQGDGDVGENTIYAAPGSIIIVPSESKKYIFSLEAGWSEWNPGENSSSNENSSNETPSS